MITFTGTHITREYGAPGIRDIAVQSMRIVRFVGAGEIFWTVGMHQLLVAELVLPVNKVHALLHDASEILMSDIPQPMKTAEQKQLERRLETRLYANLGLTEPTEFQNKLIKEADMKATCAEGTLGCGPYPFKLTQRNYNLDPFARDALQKLLKDYDQTDVLNPNGYWVNYYEDQVREWLRWQHEYEERRIVREGVYVITSVTTSSGVELGPRVGSEVSVSGLPATNATPAAKRRKSRVVLSHSARSATKRTARKARKAA